MSIRAKTEHHTLAVQTGTESDGGDDLWTYIEDSRFTCTAPEDAHCRTYPPNCGCETITEDPAWGEGRDRLGHVFEPGQPCWVKQWFDASLDECEYVGDDAVDEGMLGGLPAVDRSGHVEIVGFDAWPQWRWAAD